MAQFIQEKTKQVNTILHFLEKSELSEDGHDSTKEPFFRGSKEKKTFSVNNENLPIVPDAVNRHIKVLYEIIGNPEVEVYIGDWKILSLNKALEIYEQFCKEGQTKVFDIAYRYCGMGHIRVMSCDLDSHMLFYRPDGGSNGWDREANHQQIVTYDKKDYEYMYFTQWMSAVTNTEM